MAELGGEGLESRILPNFWSPVFFPFFHSASFLSVSHGTVSVVWDGDDSGFNSSGLLAL